MNNASFPLKNCHSFDGELSGYTISSEPITDAIQWASQWCSRKLGFRTRKFLLSPELSMGAGTSKFKIS